MEIPAWVWIVLIILSMYYLRFYQPQIYTPVMDLVDNTVKMVFDMIAKAVSGITHKPITLPDLNSTTAVNST